MSRKKGLSLIQIFMYDARMYCTVLFLFFATQTVDKGASSVSSCEAVRISGAVFFLMAISAAVPYHPGTWRLMF